MFQISKKESVRKAIYLGVLCAISYLAIYIARNILGSVSPKMIEGGAFDAEQIGLLSSVYFITYAVGQLINGAIGDKIKPKYMISIGLVMAGAFSFLFVAVSDSLLAAYVVYGMVGFFLSMIYGPMVKIIAENVDPLYTHRCTLGYTFSSFVGTPMAGVLAAVLAWQGVFGVSASMLVIMGIICFFVLLLFEKKGIIKAETTKRTVQKGKGWKILLRYHIIRFTMISVITGVVRTTVVFWLPTYISQYLGFSAERAALLFTVSTFMISMTAFLAVFIFERLGRKMNLTILIGFCVAAVAFLVVYLVKIPAINIVFLVIAIMFSNCCASMIWNRYCPGLRDTGMVSGVTGYLDFASYMAASISSSLFANSVSVIGWDGLILVWLGLMCVGIVIMHPWGQNLKDILAGKESSEKVSV